MFNLIKLSTLEILNHWRSGIPHPKGLVNRLYPDSWKFLALSEIPENDDTHNGCVNALCFSGDGHHLISAGDDLELAVWDVSGAPSTEYTISTEHESNIFCLRELQRGIVASCSMDTTVRVTNVFAEEEVAVFRCHDGQVRRIGTSPVEPHVIITAGEDGYVKMLDTREVVRCDGSCTRHNIAAFYQGASLHSVSVAKNRPHLIAACGEQPFTWLMDRRMLPRSQPAIAQFMPTEIPDGMGVSSVALDSNGRRLLGSWLGGRVHMFDTEQGILDYSHASSQLEEESSPMSQASETIVVATSEAMTFKGSFSEMTIKDVQFVGPEETHVASGSDDGNFFIWNAVSGKLEFLGFDADADVVNCVVSHPKTILVATSGIDSTVKFWTPSNRVKPYDADTCERTKRVISLNEENIQNRLDPDQNDDGSQDFLLRMIGQHLGELTRQYTQM